MHVRIRWIIAGTMIAVPAAALARDQHYPWKANVERAAFDAEQGECVAAAKRR